MYENGLRRIAQQQSRRVPRQGFHVTRIGLPDIAAIVPLVTFWSLSELLAVTAAVVVKFSFWWLGWTWR